METLTKQFIEFFLYDNHRRQYYTLRDIKRFLNLKKTGLRRLSTIITVLEGLGILKFQELKYLGWFNHTYVYWGVNNKNIPRIKFKKKRTNPNLHILWTEYIVARLLDLHKMGYPETTIPELYNWFCTTLFYKEKTFERRISDILNIACGTGLVGKKGRVYWWIGISRKGYV